MEVYFKRNEFGNIVITGCNDKLTLRKFNERCDSSSCFKFHPIISTLWNCDPLIFGGICNYKGGCSFGNLKEGKITLKEKVKFQSCTYKIKDEEQNQFSLVGVSDLLAQRNKGCYHGFRKSCIVAHPLFFSEKIVGLYCSSCDFKNKTEVTLTNLPPHFEKKSDTFKFNGSQSDLVSLLNGCSHNGRFSCLHLHDTSRGEDGTMKLAIKPGMEKHKCDLVEENTFLLPVEDIEFDHFEFEDWAISSENERMWTFSTTEEVNKWTFSFFSKGSPYSIRLSNVHTIILTENLPHFQRIPSDLSSKILSGIWKFSGSFSDLELLIEKGSLHQGSFSCLHLHNFLRKENGIIQLEVPLKYINHKCDFVTDKVFLLPADDYSNFYEDHGVEIYFQNSSDANRWTFFCLKSQHKKTFRFYDPRAIIFDRIEKVESVPIPPSLFSITSTKFIEFFQDSSSKIRIEAEMKDNKKNGNMVTYHVGGNIKSFSQWKDDKFHGLYRSYFADGSLDSSLFYLEGELQHGREF
jgi:hypothetical protein